jgi:hypothetical protein
MEREWFIPLMIILFGVIAYFSWKEEQKRKAKLTEWARRNNWSFRPDKYRGLDREYPAIKLFDRGHSRFGKNVVKGHFKGFPVTCLDYQYTTGSGKNRKTHRYGVVVVEVDHPVIPLEIRREHIFDKVGEFLGMDDIDFESSEFSRKFYVKSPDRKWAFDVIHSRTMEYLLKSPDYFIISFGHNEIAVEKGGSCEPEQYEEAVKLAIDLFEMIPDYVREQMGGK